ncbi:MAG: hypothetical protein JO329_15655, partial [Planctomycetaceae bacterium]|nr:hypothetical protein [Planctomycetaceae bacterium]
TSLPRTLKPTRSGPVRPATATGPTTRATPAARPGPLHPAHHTFGPASNRAEARSHRRAGRLHDAPGAGGDAAEVLEEVRRRLAIGPEHDGLVAEAVEDARAGRRPRW